MVTTAPGSTSLTSATSPLKIQGWTRTRGSRPRLSRRTGGFTRQAYRSRGGLDQHGPRLLRRPGAAAVRQLSLRVEVERVVVARELFAALDVARREVGLAVGHIRVVRVIHVPRVVSTEHDRPPRSEEHTSELQSQSNLVCRLLLEKKKKKTRINRTHNTR